MRLSQHASKISRGYDDVILERTPDSVEWVPLAGTNGAILLKAESVPDLNQPNVTHDYRLSLNKSDLIQIFAALSEANVSLTGISTLSRDSRESLNSHISALTEIVKAIPG